MLALIIKIKLLCVTVCFLYQWYKSLFFFFFFWLHWFFDATHGLSLVGEQRLLSLRRAEATHHCGVWAFSLWWLLLLQSTGSRAYWLQLLWCLDLVAPWHVGFSQTRDWTHVPCMDRRILNHWAPGKSNLYSLDSINSIENLLIRC